MYARLAFVLSVAFVSLGAFAADPLPRAKPETVGMSSERLARIGEALNADIEKGRLPGAVIAVARKGKLVYYEAYGFRDKAAGTKMTNDTIFNIASMTKPMTAVGALQLLRAGQAPDRRSGRRNTFRSSPKMQVAVLEAEDGERGHRHGAGRSADHDPGPDAAHLRHHLWRPRRDAGAQALSRRRAAAAGAA